MKITFWIICSLEWSVLARRGDKRRSFISTGDHNFVGDDPVLTAELTRRMAKSRPPPEALRDDQSPPPGPPVTQPPRTTTPNGSEAPSASPSSIPSPRYRVRKLPPEVLYSRREYWDIRDAKKAKVAAQKKPSGNAPSDKEYPKDWNATQLYAMHLKVAEQAIYGLQLRLEDMTRITHSYEDNPLLRIAYILRRLDTWEIEMKDFYDYSHRTYVYHKPTSHWWKKDNTANNPWWFPNIRHILYYQAMLRRYIDILYSVEYLRVLNAAELGKQKENDFEEMLKKQEKE